MDKLDFTGAEFRQVRAALTSPGQRRVIHLDLLDLWDGSHISTLTARVLDGQVVYDTTQMKTQPSRMLDIKFLDPLGRINIDPDDPSEAPIHRSRMLKVTYSVYVPALSRWASFGVFKGPIYDFQRDGGEVSLTAHGMERQALGQLWQGHTFAKKSKVTSAIRWLLNAVGDTNAQVPDLAHTLPHPVTVHPMDSAWPHIQKLAASLDRFAFYDGYGRFHLRPHSSRAVYTFDRALLDHVTPQRTSEGIINTVQVLGPKTKGPKKRVRAHATLAGPLSPTSLGRNGVPLRLVYQTEREHLKTAKQAQAIANRLLREKALTRTDISWPSLPLPFLEEHDMVAVRDDNFGTRLMRMQQWTLPLGGGDPGGSQGPPMTVGTIRRTTKARLRH